MRILEDLNDNSFLLDGVPYSKVYQLRRGSSNKKVTLINIYDIEDVLFRNEEINQIEIFGEVQPNINLLMIEFEQLKKKDDDDVVGNALSLINTTTGNDTNENIIINAGDFFKALKIINNSILSNYGSGSLNFDTQNSTTAFVNGGHIYNSNLQGSAVLNIFFQHIVGKIFNYRFNSSKPSGDYFFATEDQIESLNTQISGIQTLLNSDNINLDSVQEIVEAIETLQASFDTILVNDLVTGGITKALTAEQGVVLKALIDGKEDVISTLPISKGGTNSNTPLLNDRLLFSIAGAIKEIPKLLTDRLIFADANGLPVQSANLFWDNVNQRLKVGSLSATLGGLDVVGSITTNLTTIPITGTVGTNANHEYITNAAVAVTRSLPAAAANIGREITISRGTGSTGAININSLGGNVEALNGALVVTTTLSNIGNFGAKVTFKSNGTNWLRKING